MGDLAPQSQPNDPYLNDDDDDRPLYVVTTSSWGKERSHLVAALSLKDAKATYGSTRERYTDIDVRRARRSDGSLPRPTPSTST